LGFLPSCIFPALDIWSCCPFCFPSFFLHVDDGGPPFISCNESGSLCGSICELGPYFQLLLALRVCPSESFFGSSLRCNRSTPRFWELRLAHTRVRPFSFRGRKHGCVSSYFINSTVSSRSSPCSCPAARINKYVPCCSWEGISYTLYLSVFPDPKGRASWSCCEIDFSPSPPAVPGKQ